MKKINRTSRLAVCLTFLLGVSACGEPPLTRAETIAAAKECNDAGLKANILRVDNRVSAVDCGESLGGGPVE